MNSLIEVTRSPLRALPALWNSAARTPFGGFYWGERQTSPLSAAVADFIRWKWLRLFGRPPTFSSIRAHPWAGGGFPRAVQE